MPPCAPALGWGWPWGWPRAPWGGRCWWPPCPTAPGGGGGQATAVAAVTVTRGLWSDCATDATGVTSCVPLVSLLTLPAYLQGSRALALGAAVLGAPGPLLPLLGAAGGNGGAGPRGVLLLLAGLGALGAAAWFGAAVSQEFFDPQHAGVSHPLGAPPAPGRLRRQPGGQIWAQCLRVTPPQWGAPPPPPPGGPPPPQGQWDPQRTMGTPPQRKMGTPSKGKWGPPKTMGTSRPDFGDSPRTTGTPQDHGDPPEG
ncbi:claudin-9-like isoform X1 [Anser cygnoides]|uniref:claudin-9-like isoform X1 n=1 Tax=Anser cygnoides TaxID=8845 RepID=UPI0034D2D317